MFKIGDKIKVLDANQTGEVLSVEKHRVTIMNEFGFEEIYNESELILNQDLQIADFKLLPEKEISKSKIQKTLNQPKEVDLHIGHLVDYTLGLSNFDMLQIQLNKVKSEIELARKEKQNRLIFIHGHGAGKLREELYKLLESYTKLEFYDASFRKYKLGATEVRLY